MRGAQTKDMLREMWHTKSRFLAIFAIIALGTGFFAGVKVTCPDMKLTADKYFKDYTLMDLKVVSTYGLNKEDISAIERVGGVNNIMPAYSIDAIIKTDEEDRVAKIHSIPLDKLEGKDKGYLNQVRILGGRLPKKSGECVIEKSKMAKMNLKLGDKITFNSGKEDKPISGYISRDTFEIVGYVETPYYLTFEKGTSTLGNGTVSLYVIIPEEDFKMKVFTEVFLTLDSTRELSSFSQKYLDAITDKKTELEEVAKKREEQRYKEVYNGAKTVKPQWYIMDRNSNAGYTSYKDDTERVDAIAKIFPVFFFIVAAFVCLTTMTRMVEEHRTQIGTYKALGYGNFAIALKFLIYTAIASVFGSIVGLVVGLKLFPYVISNAYGMLYRLPPIITPLRIDYILWVTLGALVCTSTAVYFACYRELWEHPASLMRPKSPKMGKRVFLERVPFIWSRLNFFSKVTIRNLFRYKKRLIMTLLGVAGCTALMLAGFGLRDAISSIVPMQYGEVFRFNSMIIIDETAAQADKTEVYNILETNNNNKEVIMIRLKNFEAGRGDEWQKINLLVPEDTNKLERFISIHKFGDEKPIELSDAGVIIGEKLAKLLNVKIGSEITIKVSEFKKVVVKVIAINENYTLHYVYMTPKLYEKVFGEKLVINSILVNMLEVSQQAEDKISRDLVNNDAILQVNFTSSNKKSFSDMVNSLNSIVFVMIISAGALAFVVLYNLTNININERIREIASIKVLGFYDLEVSQYVFRENIILTLINICFGLVGGIVLNRFVLQTSETDVVMFGREIYWYSYVLAAALTVVFALLVNIIMHFKLKSISMIESLKSVE